MDQRLARSGRLHSSVDLQLYTPPQSYVAEILGAARHQNLYIYHDLTYVSLWIVSPMINPLVL